MIRAPSRGGDRTHPAGQRGQIHVDFVVGMVLFLVALTFVVAAIPQLLAPYDDQATPVVADRVAASLGDSLLVGDNDPGMLDPDCVKEYFGVPGSWDCSFSSPDLAERSGVDESYRIHVRLTADLDGDGVRNVLYYDGGGTLGESGTYKLDGGDAFENARNGGVSLDRRLVLLDGTPVTLEVRVW